MYQTFCLILIFSSYFEFSQASLSTLNNSSLNLILGDQCVTRQEVETVIQDIVSSAVANETQALYSQMRMIQNIKLK